MKKKNNVIYEQIRRPQGTTRKESAAASDVYKEQAMNGRGITKVGGEAIRGLVVKTEKYGVVGIAQKIVDGNQRANETAIITILNHLNLLQPNEREYLQKYETKKLFNHNKIHIGNVKGFLN